MFSTEIKAKARELGFDLVGIARADEPMLADAVTRYSEWVGRGYGATMDYLRRHTELKAHPDKLLPGWKSVVCVATLYGAEAARADETRADVSLYTRGADYHDVMGEKLSNFAEWLGTRAVKARVFVDSEPVLERFWAWRAGLGWLGKNTLLINRKVGSFLFLGGLLVDVELKADTPDTDHCGRCRKCIDACPTVAITEDRFIESGKCIAYHTIENRGAVPPEVMAGTGRWIAGCDICQNVCPWNDPMTTGATFETTNPVFEGDLRELARWSAVDFKTRLAGIAMSRMKYVGFLRNVTVAVANSGLSADEKRLALKSLADSIEAQPEGVSLDGARAAMTWALRQP